MPGANGQQRDPSRYGTTIFQDGILAHLWRDKALGMEWAARVQPDAAADGLREAVLVVLQQYYAMRSRPPTRNELVSEVLQRARSMPPDARKAVQGNALRYAKVLKHMELPPAEDAAEDVAHWVACHALADGLLGAQSALERGDLDGFWAALRTSQANMLSNSLEEAVELGAAWLGMEQEYNQPQDPHAGIFGLPKLDKLLARYGLPCGCLLCIMAAPKFGKTTSLINIAVANAQLGKLVLYVTLEIRKEELVPRMVSSVARLRTQNLRHNRVLARRRVTDWVRRCKGGLVRILQYPPNTLTLQQLRGVLTQMEVRGRAPDVLIVDYGDLLRPPRREGGAEYDAKREGLSATYTGLRALAMEMSVPVFTASQSNRAAARKRTATLDDIAEDYGKVAISDCVVSLNQSAEEERQNIARIFVCGSRIGPSLKTVYASYDRDRALLRAMDPEKEAEWRQNNDAD